MPARSAATNSKVDLRLDWCSHEAAKFAVEHWHYSRRMPNSKLVRVGVWEDSVFVGAVIYGAGATPEIAKPFGLTQQQVCELVRVALFRHESAVSRILAISAKMVAKSCPGLKLIVSFADSSQGHHGGIYQGAGWVFIGSKAFHAYRVLGEMVHPRTLYDRYGVGGQSVPWLKDNVDPRAERVVTGIKHKYILPLDAEMREKIAKMAKPYPKRAGSESGDTSAIHAEKGGSTPTPALVDSKAAEQRRRAAKRKP